MNTENKSIRLPLFWKFAIISTIIVVMFGSINIFLLWNSVYQSFEKEIDKRCTVLAKIIAEKALTPIVYNDDLSLHNILDEIKQSDPSISYIFILNNNFELIAHTYDINIPKGLIDANSLNANEINIKVIKANNFDFTIIRDIAFPILNGEIGTVRLGIVEEQIRHEMIRATKYLMVMVISFFIIGITGAFYFSHLITSPIKKISQKAQIIDLDSIDLEHNIIQQKNLKVFNVQINDELDVLVTKFSEMIHRLNNSHIDLKEAQKALIQAEKLAALGTLSAGVAHEINNPISGIKNCINRINKNPDNVEQNANYIILIKEAVNKIENVVKHLLDFSRKENITFERILVNQVIEKSISLSHHKLESSHIHSKFISANNCYTNGSANHLEQVFVNLIINSIDAISERKEKDPHIKGEIEITVKNVSDKVFIHFKDNGMGIPEVMKNKVFNPFFTSKKVGKGTGLGLSVSFNLIKEHKGSIFFSSQEGSGTEFIIELPCSKEDINLT
ncbi:MAG: two-component sensor histidine kinase [Bacteroidales bacterium]|nr:two-component sensor histidine kinase [Bacteroidales bacterium]